MKSTRHRNRRLTVRTTVWQCILAIFLASIAKADESFDADVSPLVESACLGCHDSETETGLNFEVLGHDLSERATFLLWEKVHDQIVSGDMPPADEARPDSRQLLKATQALEQSLRNVSAARQQVHGRTSARRLTKLEYGYTMRDLLMIDADVERSLPDETESGSFDTVGARHRISPVHMDAYLRSAEQALSIALEIGPDPYRDHRFDIPNSPRLAYHDGKTFIDGGGIYRRAGEGLILFTEVDFLLPSHAHGFDVPRSGTYRITIEADAFQSQTPVIMKVISKSVGGTTRLLAAYDVAPGPSQEFTVTAVLHPGDSFYPAFVMGEGTDMAYIMKNGVDDYTGKGLAIRSYRVEGPLPKQWPPPSASRLLAGVKLRRKSEEVEPQIEYPSRVDDQRHEPQPGYQVELGQPPMEHIETIVSEFSKRAFRRPTTDQEIGSFANLAKLELQRGGDFMDALQVSLRSILSSPQYLVLDSPPGQLDDYALASRLSYFLWRSMPDSELFSLAAEGKLSDPAILRQQVNRLLADKRAKRFVRDFLGQWLRLYKINATTPDQRLYWEYDELLGNSLVRETERFFTELIEKDLPAENLIDSDFTFLNRRLAEHYRISGVEGQELRRVSLPEESLRGGVLTHASVLKTTANGSVTSPVVRGNFVLSNFLGTPPPPPPPSVGSIEPDTRGTTTIREQLAAHRNNDACNLCHREIDAPGFALESFDPIGSYRDRYRAMVNGKIRQDLPVDASGVTADGKHFSDIREYKQLLLEQKGAFAANLISQLVVFATGGEIEFADRAEIDAIASRTSDTDYRLREVLHEIIQSRLFRNM